MTPDLADEDVKTLSSRLTPTLGLYAVMILVGLFVPVAAVVGYLGLALFILIPFSAVRHRPSEACTARWPARTSAERTFRDLAAHQGQSSRRITGRVGAVRPTSTNPAAVNNATVPV